MSVCVVVVFVFFFCKQKTAYYMRISDWSSDVCSSDLDGAFNNAGLPPVNVPLHQLTCADFQRSLDINVLGVLHCMKHQIAAMLKAGSGGSIVNTASVGGTVAIPAHGEYIAAKHAVIGLTRIAAVDYGQQGIRVNAVLPGAIRTPMLMSVIEN